jgi:hypothetical protein
MFVHKTILLHIGVCASAGSEGLAGGEKGILALEQRKRGNFGVPSFSGGSPRISDDCVAGLVNASAGAEVAVVDVGVGEIRFHLPELAGVGRRESC